MTGLAKLLFVFSICRGFAQDAAVATLGFSSETVMAAPGQMEVRVPVEFRYDGSVQGRSLVIGIVTSKRNEGDAFAKAGLEYVPLAEAITFDSVDGNMQTKSVTLSLLPNFERYNESVLLNLALASDTGPLPLAVARSEVRVLLAPGRWGVSDDLVCKCHRRCNHDGRDDFYCMKGFPADAWSPGTECRASGVCVRRSTSISRLQGMTALRVDSRVADGSRGSCCQISDDCADSEYCNRDKGQCQLFDEAKQKTCFRDRHDVFGRDTFSCKVQRAGAFVAHILGVLYAFAALYIIVEQYFVPALLVVVEQFGISDSVAGSTVLAVGGSAGKLCTVMMSVFVTNNDIGIATVLGSAVYGFIVIIGTCSFFAKSDSIRLDWWPVVRDTAWLLIALCVLIGIVCNDNTSKIHLTAADAALVRHGVDAVPLMVIVWWEALILLLVYVAYVVFGTHDRAAEAWLTSQLAARGIIMDPAAAEVKSSAPALPPNPKVQAASPKWDMEKGPQYMDAKNAPDTAPPLAKPVLGTRQLNPWDGWGEPVVAENESETAVIPLPKDAADSGDADGAGSWMKRADGDDTSTTEDVARAGVHTPVKKMRGGRSSEEDGLPDLATSQLRQVDNDSQPPTHRNSIPDTFVVPVASDSDAACAVAAAPDGPPRKKVEASGGPSVVSPKRASMVGGLPGATTPKAPGTPKPPGTPGKVHKGRGRSSIVAHGFGDGGRRTAGGDRNPSPKSAADRKSIFDETFDEKVPERKPISWYHTPSDLIGSIRWAILAPISFVCAVTIPDCRLEARRPLYPIAVLMCLFWLGGASFWMVWWVTLIAEAIRIPIVLVSITVVAWGVTMPDLISSIVVTKAGKAGLAVSALLSTSIFDVCFCLGFPWLVSNVITQPARLGNWGTSYNKLGVPAYNHVGPTGVVYLIIFVFVLLGLSVAIMVHGKWHIGKRAAALLFSFYFLFILLMVLGYTKDIDISSLGGAIGCAELR